MASPMARGYGVHGYELTQATKVCRLGAWLQKQVETPAEVDECRGTEREQDEAFKKLLELGEMLRDSAALYGVEAFYTVMQRKVDNDKISKKQQINGEYQSKG